MMPVRMLPMGQGAVLLQCSSLAQVMALDALLRADAAGSPTLSGVRDVVAAARTVLVRCDSPAAVEQLKRLVAAATLPEQAAATGRLHTLATVYDGDDLQEAARLAGLGPEALRTWHSGQDWVAAFGGFAPGFMYLTPTDRALALPRRDTPRTQVPAGSVAVAGEFSAVYPGPTPGGWQLLGHSAAVLWDAARADPALIQPGDIVRFSPVRDLIALSSGPDPAWAEPAPAPPSQTEPPQAAGSADPAGQFHGLRVLAPGMFTIVQDLGRPGFAHLGVTGSGALDRAALRRANRMVGNTTDLAATSAHAAGAAALETVLAGLQLKAAGTHVLAVAGGPVALRVEDEEGDQRPVPLDTPFVLRDGETITLLSAAGDGGFRSYVAVRGGFDLPQVLGSRATDVLSGLGPAPLRPGAFLPVAPYPRGSIVGFPEPAPPPPEDCSVLRYLPGPRQDWFTPESVDSFEHQEWGVDGQSNRVGLRLSGTPLVRAGSADGTQPALQTGAGARAEPAPPAELPSEGMVEGALQVPPSGLPVLFLADHPVTGGYPVLGVVLAEDLGKAAQLAPGARVRFIKVPVSSGLG
ncbi:5-oxoprolinase/urea amidolyase family protein [Arthrobacter sp.]|uniref:5-oxoprolinase subunit B/C family protein n=1 Tax=Arthrobacter sp. TaxID=1667 RepID=UPI0026DF63EC|nr:5-oxoprolinase/urea amidolyase family protein [Arthrobacter sp.]MDO5754030.1 5-oxoprolinase/urea amidolyase family protein [Arthrobacter sp.]